MPQLQGVRREDGQRRPGIAAAREDVENDVGGMDALIHGLGAGGFDRRQPVIENRGEDFHHLPIAVGGAAVLEPGRLLEKSEDGRGGGR